MDDIKRTVAVVALNDMMSKGHFNICAIDRIAEMLGVNPKGEAYRTLAPLHCVDFSKMPPELKQMIPGLIKQCLDLEPTYQFVLPKAEQAPGSQRGIMKLLGMK